MQTLTIVPSHWVDIRWIVWSRAVHRGPSIGSSLLGEDQEWRAPCLHVWQSHQTAAWHRPVWCVCVCVCVCDLNLTTVYMHKQWPPRSRLCMTGWAHHTQTQVCRDGELATAHGHPNKPTWTQRPLRALSETQHQKPSIFWIHLTRKNFNLFIP